MGVTIILTGINEAASPADVTAGGLLGMKIMMMFVPLALILLGYVIYLRKYRIDDAQHALVIIDQTKLPNEVEILRLTRQKDIWNAIYLLQVRGAPAIGVAAAIGVYLAAREIKAADYGDFCAQFKKKD